MESEFPSNTHKEKQRPKKAVEEKRVERVVETEAVRRKKPLGKKFAETFVGGDAKSAWGFVVLDVLIPAAKDMIADAVSQGVERMIYGDARSTSRRGGRRPDGPYISYNKISQGGRRAGPDPRQGISRRARAQHDFDEIILATRVEGEEVIDRLFDLVAKYEMATVGDLYELVGISGTYTDDKWGWTDLRGAGVARVRNGYLLDLPRPEPLD